MLLPHESVRRCEFLKCTESRHLLRVPLHLHLPMLHKDDAKQGLADLLPIRKMKYFTDPPRSGIAAQIGKGRPSMIKIGLYSEDRTLHPLLSSALGKEFQVLLQSDQQGMNDLVSAGNAMS